MSALPVRNDELHCPSTREKHDRRHKLSWLSMHATHPVFQGVWANKYQVQRRSDIRQYLKKFRPEAVEVADTFPIVFTADVPDHQKNSTDPTDLAEADMDAELAIGISWPTSFMAWSTGR